MYNTHIQDSSHVQYIYMGFKSRTIHTYRIQVMYNTHIYMIQVMYNTQIRDSSHVQYTYTGFKSRTIHIYRIKSRTINIYGIQVTYNTQIWDSTHVQYTVIFKSCSIHRYRIQVTYNTHIRDSGHAQYTEYSRFTLMVMLTENVRLGSAPSTATAANASRSLSRGSRPATTTTPRDETANWPESTTRDGHFLLQTQHRLWG